MSATQIAGRVGNVTSGLAGQERPVCSGSTHLVATQGPWRGRKRVEAVSHHGRVLLLST